jgi:hypothetical protein
MNDEPDNDLIIWRWSPETKDFDKEDPHRHDQTALEYAIEKCDTADAGIVVWGRYRHGWVCNPMERAVIVKLLFDLGHNIELPKARIN